MRPCLLRVGPQVFHEGQETAGVQEGIHLAKIFGDYWRCEDYSDGVTEIYHQS